MQILTRIHIRTCMILSSKFSTNRKTIWKKINSSRHTRQKISIKFIRCKMAHVSSICKFCNKSSEIKWKWITCKIYLCDGCSQQIHSKTKPFKEHNMINLQKCGNYELEYEQRKEEIQNLPCQVHCKETCVVYTNLFKLLSGRPLWTQISQTFRSILK